jgi:3-deoxy-D-manno-octulosonate 8-phosphate phosphatase (KDO 8-P phosphatase)
VRLLLLDCDGVMTDGTILVTGEGDEIKRFNILDGHGIVLWRRAGRRAGVLTGRGSRALERRVEELGIEFLIQRSLNKLESFEAFLAETGVATEEIAYMGDDVVDIPVLRRSGFAAVPPNAVDEAVAVAHAVTNREGGRGAVREVVDFLLEAQGLWDGLMARYRT